MASDRPPARSSAEERGDDFLMTQAVLLRKRRGVSTVKRAAGPQTQRAAFPDGRSPHLHDPNVTHGLATERYERSPKVS